MFRIIPPSGEGDPTGLSAPSVFVGFKEQRKGRMIQLWTGSEKPHRRKTEMHDLLIGLAFIGMVMLPAVVAAKSGNQAAEEE